MLTEKQLKLLFSKPSRENYFDTISRIYDIPLTEVQDIMLGFDSSVKTPKINEAQNFGFAVSNILCGESC